MRDFDIILNGLAGIPRGGKIAVGLSGGPDSMALCWLVAHWAKSHDVSVHAITVDHGLRAESAAEAAQVGAWVKDWPNIHHVVLRWEGDKPDSRILEEARAARYNLMQSYMMNHGIAHLCIAHHQDDQAETFLIRLAKGSGLDGLAGMKPSQAYGQITLLRPLLDESKEALISLCHDNNIPFVNDPTNGNEKYMRPRLRAARAVLEEEGLTSKRLAVTSKRLARAQMALSQMSDQAFDAHVQSSEDSCKLSLENLRALPDEIAVRVILKIMDRLNPEGDYGPRMEKVENLVERILRDPSFNGATLGGCLFALRDKNATLWVEKESQ
jgi:tRNA(Ile)-lysidine synthase